MEKSLLDKKVLGSLRIDGTTLYFFAFLINFIPAFLMTSMYSTMMPIKIFYYCSYLSALIILFKIFLFDHFSKSSAWFYMISIPLLFLTWKISDSDYAFITGIFILGARNIEFKKIVRWYLTAGTSLLILVMISAGLGIIQNLAYVRDGALRQSFGIIYPTDFAAHVFFLLLAYVYLRFKKFTIYDYLLIAIIAAAVYRFCDARLDVVCILLILPIVLIARMITVKNSLNGKKIVALYWIAIPLLTVITIFVTMFYDASNTIFLKFNEIFSGRLAYNHVGYEKYGFSWLGSHVVEHGWGGEAGMKAFSGHSANFTYFMLDSSFVRIFLIYGTIFAIILLGALITRMIYQIHIGDYLVPSIILLMLVSSFVDHHILDLAYNPFILVILADLPQRIQTEDFKNEQVVDSE